MLNLWSSIKKFFKRPQISKTTPIVIFGCNPFSERLTHLLDNSCIEILAFIDNAPLSSEFCGKPVYSPENFKAQKLDRVPLVIASPHVMIDNLPIIDFESIYQFKHLVQAITNEYGIQNHLLHTSALIDFLHLEFPNKCILFGIQGSGITFSSHVCTKIMEFFPKQFQTKNETSLFFEKLCHEYTQCVHQIIPEAFYFAGGFNFHMTSWKIGTTCAIGSIENLQMEIYSFTTRNQVIGPVYNYHQIPSQTQIDRLVAQKYKIFFCMRNPLDIILSFLNKVNKIDKSTNEIDMEAFCIFSKRIIEQFKLWTSSFSHFNYLSYDNIIQNPIAEIQRLMKFLGLPPRQSIARKIWKELSFKQLPSAPKNHYWSGGTDKWETYFHKQHIAFLKEHDIEEILQSYNYPIVLDKFRNHLNDIDNCDWRSYCSQESIDKLENLDTTCFQMKNFDTLSFLQNIHGNDCCISGDNFYITGSDQKLTTKIKNMLANKYINTIINSGAYPGHRVI